MKLAPQKRVFFGGLLALFITTLSFASPDFNGRWRLDPKLSTALDGWHAIDLAIQVTGSNVAIAHHMRWRTTLFDATNTYDTASPVVLSDFFRIEQRHMAVYPAKGGHTHVTASWIDAGRTLRAEIDTTVEVSQGDVEMRIYQEFRVSERGDTLTLIELHSTRNRPLVYVFKKVTEEAK
jgi:hypothetical protein